MAIEVALSEFVAHSEAYLRRVQDEGEELRVSPDTGGHRGAPLAGGFQQPFTWEQFIDLMTSLPPMDPDDTEAFAKAIEDGRQELNAQPLPEYSWD